jgi:hypothetical protein
MEAIINVTELACELAHNELKEKFTIDEDYKLDKVYKIVDGNAQYTDEAQDIFNKLNDKWEEIIMLSEVKTPSATVRWYKADIESLGYQCTMEQAEEVLELVESKHDANVGINWEVLEEWCEYVGLEKMDND